MKAFKKIAYAAMVAGLTALPSMVWADTMGDKGDNGGDTNYYRGSDEMLKWAVADDARSNPDQYYRESDEFLKWAALGDDRGGGDEPRGFYDRQVPSDEFLQFAAIGNESGTDRHEGFYDRQVPSEEFLQFAALDDGQREGRGYYERQAPDELLWAALDDHESTDEGLGTGGMHRDMSDRSHGAFYDD